MTQISYSMDTVAMLRFAASMGLAASEIDRAAVTAVNDVATKAQGTTRKEVRAYLTLPAASVNERIKVTKRASKSNLTATLTIGRRARDGGMGGNTRPTLMSSAGKPNKPRSEAKRTKTGRLTKSARAPFTYQIVKGGPRKTLPGAFVQRAKRRHNLQTGQLEATTTEQRAQAFVRKSKARYPLDVPRGLSVEAAFQAEDRNPIARNTRDDLKGRLPDRMHHQMNRIYQKNFKKISS